MHNPKVFIVIINYNALDDTMACIRSLNEILYENYTIIIVDNNSQDNSDLKIANYIKGMDNIVLLKSNENLGFSGGNNLGIEYALKNKADYVCLLNNDTIVESDFLNKLVEKMENDLEIGICSGKIMYHSSPDIIWSAGGVLDETRCIGYNSLINEKENIESEKEKSVTFLTGCLQLIRAEVFERIGLYDHEYFLYMEDVDFCKRTLNAGFKLYYIPESKIFHKVSASTGGQSSPLVVYYMIRNRLLFFKKFNRGIKDQVRFYPYFILKILTESIRKKVSIKYVFMAIYDFSKKNFGYKKLN